MSEILIVGHGKSIQNAGLGEKIDQYPVVRMKTFKKFHDEKNYGKRTDYLCSSTEVMLGMLGQAEPIEYWCYPKKGEWSAGTEKKFKKKAENYIVPLKETEYWNEIFRERSGYGGIGSEGRNISTGLAAIIIAAWRLKKDIILAGFDTLLNPALDYHSVYNPTTRVAHCHKWCIENAMLPEISEHYGVNLCALLPHSGIVGTISMERSSSKPYRS